MRFSGENKVSSSTGFRDVRINIWSEKYGPRPQPIGLILLIVLTVIALAGVFPVYLLEAEASDDVTSLEQELERIDQRIEELSLPLAAEEELVTLEAEIVALEQALETIAADRGNNIPLIDLVMSTLPGEKWLQAIQVSASSINLRGDAEDYNGVFNFTRALEEHEEFSEAYIGSMTEEVKQGRVVDMSVVKTAALEIAEMLEAEETAETVEDGTPEVDPALIVAEGESEEDESHDTSGTASTTIGATVTVELDSQVISGNVSGDQILEPPVTILFSGLITSYYPIATYTWDFGDGTTKETMVKQPGPTELEVSRFYTYTEEGNFSTTLTAADIYGEIASSDGGMFAKTEADFTAQLTTCENPQTIQFLELSTRGSGGRVRGYEWDFNTSDEESADPDFPDVNSTDPNPVYTYEEPGEYTVKLTIESSSGDKSFKEKKVKAGKPPAADFNPMPFGGDGPLVIKFVDASTPGDSGDEIALWQWTFGDGQMSTTQNPTHTYATDGPYTVTLRVVETDGNCSRVTKTVQVGNSRGAYFSAQPTGSDLSVNFVAPAGSDSEYTSYQWDFGDGDTGIGQTSAHTYDSPGTYTVSLAIIEMEDPSGSEVKGTVAGAIADIVLAQSTSTGFQITVTRAN